MPQMIYLQTDKIMDMKDRLMFTSGGGAWGVGYIGRLWLVDENSCIWNGQSIRSCYISQRTT